LSRGGISGTESHTLNESPVDELDDTWDVDVDVVTLLISDGGGNVHLYSINTLDTHIRLSGKVKAQGQWAQYSFFCQQAARRVRRVSSFEDDVVGTPFLLCKLDTFFLDTQTPSNLFSRFLTQRRSFLFSRPPAPFKEKEGLPVSPQKLMR